MRLVCWLAVASLSCPAAFGVDREFHDVVGAISDEFRTRPTHVPLLGLVNMVTFVARPAGTSHINLAIFENLEKHDRRGRDLPGLIRETLGRAWTPFVQVYSRRQSREETVLIYIRSEGHHCRLLVTSIEADQATVVELGLNPEALQRWMAAPAASAHSNHGLTVSIE